jgi:hypothetical protein
MYYEVHTHTLARQCTCSTHHLLSIANHDKHTTLMILQRGQETKGEKKTSALGIGSAINQTLANKAA